MWKTGTKENEIPRQNRQRRGRILMKIEIDTNTDTYESWQKAQKLIESIYLEPVRPLVVKPGGKEPGCTKNRYSK